MKLPKKILVVGKEHNIKENPKSRSACLDLVKSKIEIGTLNKEDISELLIHEVLEGIMVYYDLRFSVDGGDAENRHRFVLTHDDFSHICRELANSIKGLEF